MSRSHASTTRPPPQGVRGRNSNNTLIQQKLGWAPSIPLRVGMERTYRWVFDQLTGHGEKRAAFVS